MSTKTLCRWHQDGSGDGGVMRFFFVTQEVVVWFPSFRAANEFQQAIQTELQEVRYAARKGLLQQIARIEP